MICECGKETDGELTYCSDEYFVKFFAKGYLETPYMNRFNLRKEK